jgi:uncharacterized membrane protein YkoI
MTSIIRAVACTAALCAFAVPAMSQGVGQQGFYKGDVEGFHGDSKTLIKAIRGLQAADGARVVDIRFARVNGIAGYHVVLQKGGQVTFMHIDEQGGRVIALEASSLPDWMLKWKNRTDLRLDRRAKVTLVQAIRTAEGANGNAPAIAAGMATSASNPTSAIHAYNVILDISGQAKRVAIDGSNGEIIANPATLSD